MYQRILVPLDGSDLAAQALPYAGLLGKALQTRIELLRVFQPVPEQWADPVQGRYIDQFATALRNEASDYLEGVAAPLRGDGLTVACFAHEGNPAEIIISEASKVADTLVAMCTHGRSGISRWVMGSVTDKVLHGSTNPLLVVRSREGTRAGETGLRNAIVPLDGCNFRSRYYPTWFPWPRLWA